MRYLTAELLRDLLLGGSYWVIKHRDRLNQINVFPVADADTGTNLSATLYAMYVRLRERKWRSASELLREAAAELFSNARGNSGLIFSQYMAALSDYIKKEMLELKEFAHSLRRAYHEVYNSLERPMEGTILTVMREVAEAAVREETKNLEAFFERIIKRARAAVERTKELLPILKRKNVVDSGALAFFLFLEGMWLRLKKRINPSELSFTVKLPEVKGSGQQLFCTTLLVQTEQPIKAEELDQFGDSIVISRFQGLTKVHIHTARPERVKEFLSRKGTLRNFFAEPIEERVKRKREVGIIVDSGLDIPSSICEKEAIEVVPLAVLINGRSYKDEEEIYRDLVVDHLMKGDEVRSSQPSPNDFIRAYHRLEKHHKEIIAFHLSRVASGTYNSSLMASRRIKSKVHVFNTASFSMGAGLLALRAVELLDAGKKVEEVLEHLNKLKNQIYTSIYVEDLKYAVKGGRVKKWKGIVSKLFNLRLILGFSEEKGGIYLKTFGFGRKHAFRKLRKDLLSRLDRNRTYDFAIAYTRWNSVLEKFETFIKENFRVRKLLKNTTTPAIMVHAGPFAFGIFALPLSETGFKEEADKRV